MKRVRTQITRRSLVGLLVLLGLFGLLLGVMMVTIVMKIILPQVLILGASFTGFGLLLGIVYLAARAFIYRNN